MCLTVVGICDSVLFTFFAELCFLHRVLNAALKRFVVALVWKLISTC